MGKVAKRLLPNGEVRWDARYRDPDGTQKKITRLTKREAEAVLAEKVADMTRGVYIAPDAGKVTFGEYAETWLDGQGFDRSTYEAVELRIRLHALPMLGKLKLQAITASHVRTWLAGLTMSNSYKRTIFVNVSSVFSAAVDDNLIPRNPCQVRSVKSPKVESRKVVPWTVEQVHAVHDALPERFRILTTLGAGLGLRQGELFGLAVEDVDFLRGIVEVRRQVKIIGSRLVFALPKGGRTRTVPLPSSVRDELAAHLKTYPARSVTLPWAVPEGETVTHALLVTSRESKPMNRNYFNPKVWKPALTTAGIADTRDNGCHALRHCYASVLLDAGESIKAVSEYLGHADPGFTLRVYTHLLPSSTERTRKAVDAAFGVRATAVPSGAVLAP